MTERSALPHADIRFAGVMLGHALDRAVTTCLRSWRVVSAFCVALALVWLFDNPFVRNSIDILVRLAWTPTAAVIALRSVGVSVAPSTRGVFRFWLTNIEWYLLLFAPVAITYTAYVLAQGPAFQVEIVNQLWITTVLLLLGVFAAVFVFARLGLAPVVSIIRQTLPKDAFKESLALTRGRYLFCASVLCGGLIASSAPYYMIYALVRSAFGIAALHIPATSLTDQIRMAAIVATPFSVYGSLASWTVQAQLITWLVGTNVERQAEGLG